MAKKTTQKQQCDNDIDQIKPAIPPPMPLVRPTFVASLGNPGSKYADTLHSAGHTLLAALAQHYGAPSLTVNGGTSQSGDIVFYRSSSFMNVSGPPLARAWRDFSSRQAESEPRLVILHDDLEGTLGNFKIRKDVVGVSARGHNGLKSIMESKGMRTQKMTWVGVGIGPRPQSREPDVVAEFVLRKMGAPQKQKIESLAPRVAEKLFDS